MKIDWPKGPTTWLEGRTLYVSVPFTWNLPKLQSQFATENFLYDNIVVGGPAVELMPDFFKGNSRVSIGHDMPGVLQRVNPLATRTTLGCTRRCGFCAIGKGLVERGGLRELDLNEIPIRPIVCDNNILAAGDDHFDAICSIFGATLEWVDFNQGLDARLLTAKHANLIAGLIKRPTCRLALDSMKHKSQWDQAFAYLREAGIAKRNITSYALIGFRDGPKEAWERCRWIESHGVKAYPMWFHKLDALELNAVTEEQCELGWTDDERLKIMGWFYQHRGVAA